MTLLARRALYISFIIAFLIIAPAVIFYASGYKIKISNGFKIGLNLQKTGILVLDTKPRGAKIYLNGEPQQFLFKKLYSKKESFMATPAKIKNLLPGEYEVGMELDGYWSWRKKLTVTPGASTYAEDVYLFKKSLPVVLAEGEAKKVSESPDKKYLAGIYDHKTVLINLASEEKYEIKTEGAKETAWSPDGKKIIIDAAVFNLADLANPANINPTINGTGKSGVNGGGEAEKKFKWGPDSETVYYVSSDEKNNEALEKLDLKTGERKKIALGKIPLTGEKIKIIDFFAKNDLIFYLYHSPSEAKTKLNIVKTGADELMMSIDFPPSPKYKFTNPEHRLINLYDENVKILYLINPFAYLPLEETISEIKNWHWINENLLIYNNDFEIWLFDLKSGQKTIITRISDPIDKALWHPSNNYIIFSAGNSIGAIELDDREKRNTLKLAGAEKISSLSMNNDGDILYFSAKIGAQQGIYKLEIR